MHYITFVIGNLQNCKFPGDHFAQIEFQDAAPVRENGQSHLHRHIEGLPALDGAFRLTFVTTFPIFPQTSNTEILRLGNGQNVEGTYLTLF